MTSVGTVISFPIPPYANVPIAPQNYQPSRFTVSNVSLGRTTTVTATTTLNYVIGQLVRLLIPSQFGCTQLNNATGYVVSLPASNQVEVAINSSKNVNAFTASSAANQPQIIAVGNINSGQINQNGRISNITYIPGSFINISP